MTEKQINIYLTKDELEFINRMILEKIVAIQAGEDVVYKHGSKEGGDAFLKRINNKLERILI